MRDWSLALLQLYKEMVPHTSSRDWSLLLLSGKVDTLQKIFFPTKIKEIILPKEKFIGKRKEKYKQNTIFLLTKLKL